MGSPKYISGSIFFILSLWICSSCVENVELDSYEAAKIVVNCILTKSDTQTLELYYSSGTPDKEKKPIADAEVSLLFNDTVITRFQNDSGYVWSSQFKPKYGKRYRLEVIIDKDTLFAETNFPNRVDIASFQKGRYSDSSHQKYYLYDSFELRLIKSDYWLVYSSTYETTQEQFDLMWEFGYAYSNACNLWVFPHDLGKGSQKNYIGTTHPQVDNFNISSLYVADLPCFSEDSIKAMNSETVRRQLEWYPVVYPNVLMHEKFLRIPVPADFSNGMTKREVTDTPLYSPKSFVLVREFPTQYEDGVTPNELELYDFYILSDEADEYFREVYSRQLSKDSFVLQYDTNNIYTNIQGTKKLKDRAVGVFGAMIKRTNQKAIEGYFNDADPNYVYNDDDVWKAFYDLSYAEPYGLGGLDYLDDLFPDNKYY